MAAVLINSASEAQIRFPEAPYHQRSIADRKWFDKQAAKLAFVDEETDRKVVPGWQVVENFAITKGIVPKTAYRALVYSLRFSGSLYDSFVDYCDQEARAGRF